MFQSKTPTLCPLLSLKIIALVSSRFIFIIANLNTTDIYI